MPETQHFTRAALAERWACSLKSVDRLREAGLLRWIDLSGGRGRRPHVRFAVSDVKRFEEQMRRSSRGNPDTGEKSE